MLTLELESRQPCRIGKSDSEERPGIWFFFQISPVSRGRNIQIAQLGSPKRTGSHVLHSGHFNPREQIASSRIDLEHRTARPSGYVHIIIGINGHAIKVTGPGVLYRNSAILDGTRTDVVIEDIEMPKRINNGNSF